MFIRHEVKATQFFAVQVVRRIILGHGSVVWQNNNDPKFQSWHI